MSKLHSRTAAQAAPPASAALATFMTTPDAILTAACMAANRTDPTDTADNSGKLRHRTALGGGVMGKVDGSANAIGAGGGGWFEPKGCVSRNGAMVSRPAGGLGIAPIILVAAAAKKAVSMGSRVAAC